MEHKEQLAHIEKLMQRSTRFLSLSGLSGVGAGVVALVGAFIGHKLISKHVIEHSFYSRGGQVHAMSSDLMLKLSLLAAIVLVLSGGVAFYFSYRRAQAQGASLFDQSARTLLASFFPTMVVGGVFCLILLTKGVYWLILPSTLIFYGLALISSSKFTLDEILYLGISEVILGLVAVGFPTYSAYFWSLGFGVLHIAYGVVMYLRYERNSA